jgi:predicted Zn-dependent peptidase
MKNHIKSIYGKLIVLVAIATILTGVNFAQKPDVAKRGQLVEKLRQEQNLKSAKISKGNINAVNADNFYLGSSFAMAIYFSEGIDKDNKSVDYTIVELVRLIDKLEGQPEAPMLQKTLKSIVRLTTNATTARAEIVAAQKAYGARQKKEQQWYFNAGFTASDLSISSYVGDAAFTKQDLKDLQALIKIAPQGTPKELLDPMNALAKYVAKATYTKDDYVAIYDGVGTVFDSIG